MLKIGVIGAGHLGKIHLKLLLELKDTFEVIGFYDTVMISIILGTFSNTTSPALMKTLTRLIFLILVFSIFSISGIIN